LLLNILHKTISASAAAMKSFTCEFVEEHGRMKSGDGETLEQIVTKFIIILHYHFTERKRWRAGGEGRRWDLPVSYLVFKKIWKAEAAAQDRYDMKIVLSEFLSRIGQRM
jgi:hypothetical protein